MSLTKEQIEASVAHFNAISERKAGPPENRWSEADQKATGLFSASATFSLI